MIRRLAALVLASAMLHLNVVRADAACGMHGDAAPAASHEGMQHGAGTPEDETSCDTPLSPDCCQALVSCATTLSPTEGSETMFAPVIVHVMIAPAVTERPLSRSTAPEPPPPKA